MTQEDKELLLRDICARLPYKVNIQVKEWAVVDAELKTGHIDRLQYDEIEFKPYLRPMSSMTDEEKLELITLYLARDGRCRKDLRIKETELFLNSYWYVQITYNDENDKEVISTVYIGRCSYIEETDWLNKHHFDYRGLIEKGLAIEAPKRMYDTK